MVQNKGLIFSQVPTGWPVAGETLTVQDRPIDLDSTEPPKNGLLTQNYYVSFDPYQRGRMRDASTKSYSPPYQLNQPISNAAVCKVLKSANAKFQKDDVILVSVVCPTEEYSVLSGEIVDSGMVRKISNPYHLPLKTFVGTLGMPGLTAYSSFYEIGKPKKGETIFISAASGAVGQVVGQLAKREGLTVIGSVGDDEKLEFLTKELGFDDGFNYKKEKPAAALKRLAKDGIDIYFENVGGEQLEAAIDAMNTHGRIIACGMISQYNVSDEERYPIRNLIAIIPKRIDMRGFIVSDADMGPKYAEEHQKNVQKWISDGSIKVRMSETKGIDNAPEGLIGMLAGKNFGKAVLVIKDMD